MLKIRLPMPALAGVSACLISLAARAQFADSIVSYTQGTGVNPSYAVPGNALGAPTTFIGYQNADPFNPPYAAANLTEIGAAGSLTLEFNTPIQNNPGHAFGLDFIIFGHAGFTITNGDYSGGGITDGSLFTGGTASTRVSVSADGSTFYTLNPALAPNVDGLFPTDANGDWHVPVNPALRAGDFAGKDLTGIRALYAGSGGGAGYALSWAQNGTGQNVSLSEASFVRIDVLSGDAFVDAVSVVPEPGLMAFGGLAALLLLRANPGGGSGYMRPPKRTARRSAGTFPSAPTSEGKPARFEGQLSFGSCGQQCPRSGPGLTEALRLLVALSIPLLAGAATFQEDFATDPLAHGWRVFGNPDLFHWNATNQDLEVTWDSSQTNSYFQFPLGTIAARDDDFSFAFDLLLEDIAAGVNPAKPSTFELAVGLQNWVNADRTNFFRGTASTSPNLVEFDFFPDTGFGPTVWPSMWSTNSSLNYNGSTDYTILDLPVGVVMRITLSYATSNQTLSTSITTNGQPLGLVHDVTNSPSFTDFRVGTFAIESYSEAGQDGSLLAHGVVDNITLTMPPPPVQQLTAGFQQGAWGAEFISRSNWVYTLQRTVDLRSWAAASVPMSGTGTNLFLADTNAPTAGAFYRVRAERP